MIYIRNISNRIIHLADVMLLPDTKVPDEMPDGSGKKYSDSPVIQRLMEMDMLELVEVVPPTKKALEKKIKVEVDESLEPVESEESAPEDAEEDTEPEIEPEKSPAKTQTKTRSTRKKTQS